MEAPRSLKQKEGEPTMSYINKGNFWLNIECGQKRRSDFDVSLFNKMQYAAESLILSMS